MKEPMPYRGCLEDFLVLIEQFSGINRDDLYVIETPDHTRALYGALIDLINLHDN